MNEFSISGVLDGGGGDYGVCVDDGVCGGFGFGISSDSGVPNICLTNPTFALAHAQACGISTVAYTPPPQQPAPVTQTGCSISLYEMPVLLVGQHTYLDTVENFSDGSSSTQIIEGGPIPFNSPVGVLTGFNTTGSIGALGSNPNSSSNQKIGTSYTGALACGDIADIEDDVTAYNAGPKVPYVGIPALGTAFLFPGANSNSFTYTLLNGVGLSSYFGPVGLAAVGWGIVVPGL